MSLELPTFLSDFSDALQSVDNSRQAHKAFRPGIGPFGEADAVRAAKDWMKKRLPARYDSTVTKRTPDLLIPGEWAIELKIIRPFGDNGAPAEHWSENILHPYRGNTSSLGDCLKLLSIDAPERKAIVIFGYEHTPPQISLDAAVDSFEIIAREVLQIHLTDRSEQVRAGLVHPVHQQLRVFGYEVLGRL